jgi:hypothetical protein
MYSKCNFKGEKVEVYLSIEDLRLNYRNFYGKLASYKIGIFTSVTLWQTLYNKDSSGVYSSAISREKPYEISCLFDN